MPAISFTAIEIHIIVQLLRLHIEEGAAFEYANVRQLETIKTKLQNVKDG